jgi:HAMP domain-containing protein
VFRVSITAKLAASYLLVAALIVGPTLVYLRASFLSSLEQVEASTLQPRAEALRDELERIPRDQPEALEAAVRRFAMLLQMRVTVIGRDGISLNDSEVPPERIGSLDNHASRPEVREALAGRYGWARRMSASVHEELFYGAVPLPAHGPPAMVVRVARRVAGLREAATSALFTMRLSTGVAITVALLLSLGAAVYVSSPLRRMRDAAQAFAEGRWVEVPRLATRDELEDLSIALDELARRLQQQLILHGANESLLTQTVRALPSPALLLDAEFQPLELNGALRELGDLVPANEGEALTALLRAPTVETARREAAERGLPVDLSMPLPGRPQVGHVPGTLVPLTRPTGPPFWMLFVAASAGDEGSVPLVELVERAERAIDRLWAEHPAARQQLAELRARVDEIGLASGRAEPSGIEPTPLGTLLGRAIEEVRAMFPDRPPVAYSPSDPSASVQVAESGGAVLRALRTLLRIAARSSPRRAPELNVEVQAARVHLDLRGGAAGDLGEDGRMLELLASAVGGVVVKRPADERALLRLTLPRA